MENAGAPGGAEKVSGSAAIEQGANDRLAEREAHLNAIFEQSAVGMAETDPAGRFTRVNDRFCAITGRSREELLSLTMQEITHPEDLPRNLPKFNQTTARGSSFEIEKRYIRPDGSTVWVHNSVSAVRSPDGRLVNTIAISIDISARKEAEERLQSSETRLRLAVDAAHMAIWESDVRTGEVRGSPLLHQLLGFPEDEPLELERVRARYFPGERERLAAAAQQALADPDRFGEIEFRYCLPSGAIRWLLLRVQAQVDAQGELESFVGVMMDVTERKRAEEHQRLLINELNHRVKNTLAVVQSIAHQTLRRVRTPAEAQHAFSGRLVALAAAHDLLTLQNWEAAPIRRIIEDAVAAIGPACERVSVSGPDLLLPPKSAVALAMAIHELATNALKYGSLSSEEGRVEVVWQAEAEHLHLAWREQGGPTVAEPAGRGFGTRMIEQGLSADLGGKVTIEFRRDGLVCTVDAPLSALRTQV